MHAAVRPYVTAGIALVGASVIAVAPVEAPQVQANLHQIEAGIHRVQVRMTAAANPLQAYNTLFERTVTSLQGIESTVKANGATPILTSVVADQLASLADLVGLLANATASPQGASSALAPAAAALAAAPGSPGSFLTALQVAIQDVYTALTTAVPPLLRSALNDLSTLDIEGAVNNVLLATFTTIYPVTGLVTAGVETIATPLQQVVTAINNLGPLATILANPLQNVVNALNAANAPLLGLPDVPSYLVAAIGGLLGPVIEAPAASGTAIQAVIDAAKAGDLAGVVNAIIGVPAVVLDGIVNGGYGPDLSSVIPSPLPGYPLLAGGLFSAFGFGSTPTAPNAFTLPGLVSGLQYLQKAIADALKPPALSSATPQAAAANKVPDLTSTAVTLSIDTAPSSVKTARAGQFRVHQLAAGADDAEGSASDADTAAPLTGATHKVGHPVGKDGGASGAGAAKAAAGHGKQAHSAGPRHSAGD